MPLGVKVPVADFNGIEEFDLRHGLYYIPQFYRPERFYWNACGLDVFVHMKAGHKRLTGNLSGLPVKVTGNNSPTPHALK